MGELVEAMRIGADELVEIEGPPEIHRRQAFAKPGLWAGLTTTRAGARKRLAPSRGPRHDRLRDLGFRGDRVRGGWPTSRTGGRRRLPRDPQRARPSRKHTGRGALPKRGDPRRRRRPADGRGRRPLVRSQPAGARRRARPPRGRTVPISSGSSMNCDGLMQIVVNPRSSCGGIDASASPRSATPVRHRRTGRACRPPSRAPRCPGRPRPYLRAAARDPRRSAVPSGLNPLPYSTSRRRSALVHRLAAEPQRRAFAAGTASARAQTSAKR